jgi:hypothetical protein
MEATIGVAAVRGPRFYCVQEHVYWLVSFLSVLHTGAPLIVQDLTDQSQFFVMHPNNNISYQVCVRNSAVHEVVAEFALDGEAAAECRRDLFLSSCLQFSLALDTGPYRASVAIRDESGTRCDDRNVRWSSLDFSIGSPVVLDSGMFYSLSVIPQSRRGCLWLQC